MLIDEFVLLTGYRPSSVEYDEIERNYTVFDGDKQSFCKMWLAVNSATVAQYKANREKLGKMLDKEDGLVNEISYMDVVINQAYLHLEGLKQKRDKLQTSLAELRVDINKYKEMMSN